MAEVQPKSMHRPKQWSTEVENAYRFQLAGYRDEMEYTSHRNIEVGQNEGQKKLLLDWFKNCWHFIFIKAVKWPESGFVKKLQRRKDGYFYYYNRARECPDKDIPKCKIYVY